MGKSDLLGLAPKAFTALSEHCDQHTIKFLPLFCLRAAPLTDGENQLKLLVPAFAASTEMLIPPGSLRSSELSSFMFIGNTLPKGLVGTIE